MARKKNSELIAEIDALKEEALYKRAEFDNFRKRALKDREEIQKTATKILVVDLLEVLDDYERAVSKEDVSDGIKLIFDKLNKKLSNVGLEKISIEKGSEFNTDTEEAITTIPSEELKGKVIDVVSDGYKLNGNIIRFAKVVVGQ